MKLFLNLLPPDKKDALEQGFVLASAQTLTLIVLIIAIFVGGTLFSLRTIMAGDLAGITSLSSSVGDEGVTLAEDIARINSYLKRIDGFEAKTVRWSGALRELSMQIPQDIRVDELTVDKDGKITLRGLSPTREDVLTLRDRLAALPFVDTIKSPLSNILQKKNVSFEFELTHKK